MRSLNSSSKERENCLVSQLLLPRASLLAFLYSLLVTPESRYKEEISDESSHQREKEKKGNSSVALVSKTSRALTMLTPTLFISCLGTCLGPFHVSCQTQMSNYLVSYFFLSCLLFLVVEIFKHSARNCIKYYRH